MDNDIEQNKGIPMHDGGEYPLPVLSYLFTDALVVWLYIDWCWLPGSLRQVTNGTGPLKRALKEVFCLLWVTKYYYNGFNIAD